MLLTVGDEGRPSVASIIVFAVSIPPFLVTVIFWIVYLYRRCRRHRQVTDQRHEAPTIRATPIVPPRPDIEQSGQYIDLQGSLGVSFSSNMYESIDHSLADRIQQERSQMPQREAPIPPSPPKHKPKKKRFQLTKRSPKPAMPLPPLPLTGNDGGIQERTNEVKETEFLRTYEKPVTIQQIGPGAHTESGDARTARIDSGSHVLETRTETATRRTKEEDKLELVKHMENGGNVEPGLDYQVIQINRVSISSNFGDEVAVVHGTKTDDNQELITNMDNEDEVLECEKTEVQHEVVTIMTDEDGVSKNTKKDEEQETIRNIQDLGNISESAEESSDKQELVLGAESVDKVLGKSQDGQQELVMDMDEVDDDQLESTYTVVQIQRVSIVSDQIPTE